MSVTRMVIVQIDRQLISQLLVSADRILEQPFLKIARKLRPQLERRTSHRLFKA